MSDDEFIEIKLKIPKKHLFFGYTADASALRYHQEQYRAIPNDAGDEFVKSIEEYLNVCKAKQAFFTIISDDVLNPEIIPPSSDFIDEHEMEI